MFRSVRWRLVASYVLLTLLTVSLVGALALSLVERYADQRELDDLTANARVVAHQAEPLVEPVVRPDELVGLAQTSAFLGDVRVKILGVRGQILAESGRPAGVDEFVWVAPPPGVRAETERDLVGPLIIPLVPGAEWDLAENPLGEPPLLQDLPPGVSWTVVRTTEGPWVKRFVFERVGKPGATGGPAFGGVLTPPGVKAEKALTAESTTPRSARVVTVAIGEAGRPAGFVELSGGQDYSAAAIETTRRAFLLAAAAAVLVAVVVGLVVSHGLTAPLRALAAAAGRMSAGDLSARAPAAGGSEIGQVSAQFNQMAGRLEASFADLAAERDALRRFIADASHELRTPITALKTFNELLRGPAAADAGARAEFLAESQRQLDRLEWITQNLLDLSRLDAGLVALDVASHDAGEIVEAAAATLRAQAQAKGIELTARLPEPPFTVACDRARLELALCNLLDNALKFTPSGGHVEIGVERAGSRARFTVRDDGPGIDPADLPHIFERFYRSGGAQANGSGLGLAIVRSVVQAHGGRVAVDSPSRAGTAMVIELPCG